MDYEKNQDLWSDQTGGYRDRESAQTGVLRLCHQFSKEQKESDSGAGKAFAQRTESFGDSGGGVCEPASGACGRAFESGCRLHCPAAWAGDRRISDYPPQPYGSTDLAGLSGENRRGAAVGGKEYGGFYLAGCRAGRRHNL